MTEDINRCIKLLKDIYPYMNYVYIIRKAADTAGVGWINCSDSDLLRGLRILLERAA